MYSGAMMVPALIYREIDMILPIRVLTIFILLRTFPQTFSKSIKIDLILG